MKKLIYSLIVAVSILLPTTVHASKSEFKKNIRNEFNVDRNSQFEIINKNGNIVIENTDEDRITIDLTITGKARNIDDAEKICSKIEVSIIQMNGKISVRSDVSPSLRSDEYDLSYSIIMPAYLNTNLSNKYGNVIINELEGKTELKVSYGSLKIGKLNDKTNNFPIIDLAYSRQSSIDELNVGGINMSYSDITVGKGQAIAVSSKYSGLNINYVSSIAIESGYDNIDIANVGKLDLNTKYSKVNIRTLETMCRVELSYGSINIDQLKPDFSNIDISAKYANVQINVKNVTSYALNLKAKYGEISNPQTNNSNYELTNNIKSFVGQKGNPSDKKMIMVRTQYGNITIDD